MRRAENRATQLYTRNVADAPIVIAWRIQNDTGWNDWEFLNPSMLKGSTYRTTERYNNATVSKKLDTDGIIKWSIDGGSTWQPARYYLSAAPLEYGLGEQYGYALDSAVEGGLNTATRCGWYYFGGSGNIANAPPNLSNSGYGTLLVTSRGLQDSISQIAFFQTHNTIAVRQRLITEWQPWEYINPPMEKGVEYRTVERHQDKPVYKKLDTDGVIKWRLEGETEWKPEAEYLGTSDSQNPVFLKRVTTSADATSISIDVSDINFDDYYEVVMYTNLFDTSSYRSSTPMCLMRINNDSGKKYGFSNGTNASGDLTNFRYIYQGALLNTGKYASSPCKVYIRKKDSAIFIYGSYTYINLSGETWNHATEVYGEYMLGTSATFSSLQIDVEASDYATIRTGSVIEFWGYKK